MRNALKALGALLAVLVLCAPLMFLPVEDIAPASGVTVTVPPVVVVATTVPGLESTTTTTEPPSTPSTTEPVSSTTTTTPPPPEITIAAAGNVFAPPGLLESIRDPRTGSYDFDPIFAPIAPYLQKADYAIAGLQPRLAGPEPGYASETAPNAPRELAFSLKKAGIDLVGTANLHSLDLGWSGVTGTLDRLDAAGLAHAGTSRTAAERNTPVIADIKGIRVAFLDYTSAVAGSLPADQKKDFAVNLLDADTVRRDAMAARSHGADAVVAMIDHGAGNDSQMSAEQKALVADVADLFDDAPVDVILGYRAHVIQSIVHRFTFFSSASWQASDKYVAYSLGDLLSPEPTTARTTTSTSNGTTTTTIETPTSLAAPEADTGMIVYLHFQKRGLRTYVTGVSYLPLYLQTATVAANSGETEATTTTATLTADMAAKGTTTTTEEEAAKGPVTAFRILPVLPGLEPADDLALTAEDRTNMAQIWEYARSLLYRPNENMTPLSPSDLGL